MVSCPMFAPAHSKSAPRAHRLPARSRKFQRGHGRSVSSLAIRLTLLESADTKFASATFLESYCFKIIRLKPLVESTDPKKQGGGGRRNRRDYPERFCSSERSIIWHIPDAVEEGSFALLPSRLGVNKTDDSQGEEWLARSFTPAPVRYGVTIPRLHDSDA